MADYRIPVSPEPQRFSITLAGREYLVTVRWFGVPELARGDEQAAKSGQRRGASADSLPAQQDFFGGWLLDIAEPDRAAPILMGIPLVTGCDLLAPYGYLGIGGGLVVDSLYPPTLENLGAGVELVFTTNEETGL